MTAAERLQAIAAIDRKICRAARSGGRLSLSPDEVGLMIDLNMHAVISRAKDEALQEHRKWQENNRKASTDAALTGSTTIGAATAPRAALTIISSGTTQDVDGHSALQRARRISMPRKMR